MKRLIPLSILTVLVGCTLAPKYQRPDFPAGPNWNEQTNAVSSTEARSVSELDWPHFFRSPALQQVIETALKNNKDLRIASLNIEAARAGYRIQRADVLPALSADGSGTIHTTSDASSLTGTGRRSELYTANLALTHYEIDFFGKIRSLSTAALNEYLATTEAANVLRTALIAETANAYLQLVEDTELLDLTRQTLATRQATYDILSDSLEAGVSTSLDVSRATTALERAKADLAQYERFVRQDKNALILLMGVSEEEIDISIGTLREIDIFEQVLVGLPSEVLLHRPDVRQAEYQLLARNADIGAARAAFFPSISLTGAYGFESTDLSSLFDGAATGAWSLLPRITIPIFQGGRNRATLDLSELRKDMAIARYEQTIQIAFREVSDELAARRTLSDQLAAQKRLTEAAQNVYDLSQARYTAGIDNFLSVLDAQRELFAAQQTTIQLERQRLANWTHLYKALGGGSQP